MIIGIDCSRAFGNFWGGPESYSYYLTQAMLKAPSPHMFRLYLPPNASENTRYKSFFSGLKIENCELKIVGWPRLWTQAGLALECLVRPPDVLFVPAHTLPVIRRPGLKTVVTVHDLGAEYLPNYHKFPQKHYLNKMTEFAVKNAAEIIAVSQYTKKDIVKKFKVSSQKLEVIYEGYDKKSFYPRSMEEVISVKRKLGISGNYFLFVGTIQPRKNLSRLIEAFSRVLKGYRSLSLVLAGSPGWMNKEIYEAPAKFGVPGQVKFTGPVEHNDLPALITGALAFVFPSLFEGFGLAPLEALASGSPVILSQTTSLPEVGGEAALYVDPLSIEDIAGKMETVLLLTDSQRQLLVNRGLAQAEKFSWEKAAAETIQVLEKAAPLSVIN